MSIAVLAGLSVLPIGMVFGLLVVALADTLGYARVWLTLDRGFKL